MYIAKKLWKRVFSIFGIPPRMHSDRGPEFVNSIIKNLTEFLQVRHTLTTAYHPQGNAYAERIHKFINNALAQCVNKDQNDWDDITSCLMIAHNDCAYVAHGIAPCESILGRHLNLPGEEILSDNVDVYNPKSYAQKLRWILAKTQEIVQGQMAIKIARNERRSANIVTTQFKVGEAVRLWQPSAIEGKKAKLLQKWFGPYYIHEIKNQGRVIYLKDSEGLKLPLPVSVNRIWPYPEGLINDTTTTSSSNDTPATQMDVDIDEKDDESSESSEHDDSMSSDDEDEDGNEEPDVIDQPDDDNSGPYYPSNQSESDTSDDEKPVSSTETRNYKLPPLKAVTVEKKKQKKSTQLRSPPKLRDRKKILTRPVKGGYIKKYTKSTTSKKT
jgi:hypothetical protein